MKHFRFFIEFVLKKKKLFNSNSDPCDHTNDRTELNQAQALDSNKIFQGEKLRNECDRTNKL